MILFTKILLIVHSNKYTDCKQHPKYTFISLHQFSDNPLHLLLLSHHVACMCISKIAELQITDLNFHLSCDCAL